MCIFVLCDSDNDEVSLTSTTDVSCSPRWIVYSQSRTHYASPMNSATTLRQCLDACSTNPRCRFAEWIYRHYDNCWFHERDASRGREHDPNIVQFEIVRRCFDTTSGT